MAGVSIRERVLVVFDDPKHRGVGVVAQEFGNLGYRTVARSEFTQEHLRGVELLLTISIPLERLGVFLNELHAANPDRGYKVAMILPERNIPKSEIRFFDALDPAVFDGIAHVSTGNLLHWREKFPDKLHGYFQNPSTILPAAPKVTADPSVISSGVFATFKGLGVLLKGAQILEEFPELTFSYTGCQYQISGQTGKIVGSLEVVTSLASATDLKEKPLRPNIWLRPDDDWTAREPGGKLNVFPSYKDRAENSRRISESGVYLFTPCAVIDDRDFGRAHIRGKHLLRWTSAVDYNLLEAMASGTPVLISHAYYHRLLTHLERYSKEKLGRELNWPIPFYDDLRESGELALDIVRSSNYEELSRLQLEYFEGLRDAGNALLEEDLLFFLGEGEQPYGNDLDIPKGTKFFREGKMTLPSAKL